MTSPHPPQKPLLLAYLIRYSPIDIFLTSSRPGKACHFLKASTRAGSRPSRPRFCRSKAPVHPRVLTGTCPLRNASKEAEQFLDSFHAATTSTSSSAPSSCIPNFSHWQPGYTEIFAAVPAQWIRSVMINTFFYLPAPRKSCHHPNSQATAIATTKTSPSEKVSKHPPTCDAHKGQEFGQDRQEID